MSGAPDTNSQPGNSAQNQTPAPADSNQASADANFEDSILDTLRYDPFGSSKGAGAQTSPGATSPRSEQQPAQPPVSDGVPGNAPAPTSQGAQPQAQPQPQPNADAIALQAATAQLQAATQQLQSQQAPAQSQQKTDDLPAYVFDIPPALVNALASEDPVQRTTAVQHLVAGTARAVHTEVLKLMNEVKSSIPQIFNQQMQAHTYRETIRRDFYGKYPMLDNPHLAPTVASVTQQVMSEIQSSGGRPAWSPQLAQAIAERVFTLIPGLRAQAPAAQPQQQAVQQIVPQAQSQPPHMFTPGARPVQGPSLQADIEATLFG